MSGPSSLQAYFSAAEQAYVSGRPIDARESLLQLEKLGVRHAAVHHLRAIVEREIGDLVASRQYFESAVRLAPNDAQISNNFGNLLGDLGEEARALSAYDRALSLAPAFAEAMFNRALLLQRSGRLGEARSDFVRLVGMQPGDPRFWCGLASVEMARRDLAAAADGYERALALQPDSLLAASGRARVALERGEEQAVARYHFVRQLAPDDRQLMFEETEARLAEGDTRALDEFDAFVAKAPDWTLGQVALARMLYVSGDTNRFSEHIQKALRNDPRRSDLWGEYIELLGSCGLADEAADAARDARSVFDGADWLTLTEAAFAGRAGQLDRAEALLEALPEHLPGRAIHDTIHKIRRGNLDDALHYLEAALAEDHWNHSYWAIAELLYRKTNHSRSEWLSGQEGMIGTFELALDDEAFAAVEALLLRLHQNGTEMVGQSVRHGTQTRWRLFERLEPELAPLSAALEAAVEVYMSRLPPADPGHPMLRHRDKPVRISGSWSVRLTGAGYHVPHVHPEGTVSSACYLRVPETGNQDEGRLELGRPPADLRLSLDAIETIEPRLCRLVLFPSFLYHGTRSFSGGERMSVAFDVAPRIA